MFKNIRRYAAYLVLFATIIIFWKFIQDNPNVIDQLRSTKLITIFLILILYGLMTGVLATLYKVMTDICNAKIPSKENLLLTMYSSVVNFFGPLQSGPGFRMVYLKKKYNVNVAKYIGVSLLYYVFFGVSSGLMLLSSILGLWIIPATVAITILTYFFLPQIIRSKIVKRYIPNVLPWKSIGILAILSLVQVLVVTVIYFVEISSVQSGVSFAQAVVYTGAANFALFVSLTPGALGFRESFLYFSRDLHHISQTTIVSANIIDRSVYLVFLGLLLAIIVATHSIGKFQTNSKIIK